MIWELSAPQMRNFYRVTDNYRLTGKPVITAFVVDHKWEVQGTPPTFTAPASAQGKHGDLGGSSHIVVMAVTGYNDRNLSFTEHIGE